MSSITSKPFLKWAGGKRRLLTKLTPLFPKTFNNYYEPFLGAGAVMFHISQSVKPKNIFVSDINAELINTYHQIQKNPRHVINHLYTFINEESEFYRVREMDRLDSFQDLPASYRAARMIYLNKTAFNGLYRVNSKGQFNVSFGKYKNPTIVDEENLLLCHKALQGIEISHGGYETVGPSSGDFVYMDPPYVPLTVTSSFTQYTQDGFTNQDHHRLAIFCDSLDRAGVKFMLSNSNSPVVEQLYAKYNIQKISVQRNIAADGNKRTNVKEIIVTNY